MVSSEDQIEFKKVSCQHKLLYVRKTIELCLIFSNSKTSKKTEIVIQ